MLEHGGRIELKLLRVGPELVVYALDLVTPARAWQATATLRLADGRVEIGAHEGQADSPPWLCDAARALLRSLWRARTDGSADWPKRVTRWRAEPSP
jgi:hypothetical protein